MKNFITRSLAVGLALASVFSVTGNALAAALTFTEITITPGTADYRAKAVVLSDLDEDGDIDFVVGDRYYDRLYWYRNNGSEVFTELSVDATFTRVEKIIVIDFDQDNDLDVVATGSTETAWYENNGSETFTAHANIAAHAESQFDVADIDSDGDYDLVLTAWAAGDIFWYENNGSMSFTQRTVDAAWNTPWFVCSFDFDGDTDIDIIGTSQSGNKIGLFTNNGSESFTTTNIDAAFNTSNYGDCEDIDDDGDIDFVVGSRSGHGTAIYLNNGSASFAKTTIGTTGQVEALEIADLDGDGDEDIVIGDHVVDDILWYDNNGSEVFTERTVDSAMSNAGDVDVADIDGDGDMDVAAGATADGEKIKWYQSAGSDSTAPTVSSFSPLDNATGVSTTANLVITFAEAVDAETGNITIKRTSDDTTFETIGVTSGLVTGSGTTTITINPSGTFAEQTGYYVQVDATGFDDAASNSYAGIADTTTWSFTVGDFTNPTVSTLSPADNATGTGLTANLVMTFDEAVDVETGNITIKLASDDSTFETIDVTSGLVTGSGTTTITINPSGAFSELVGYYVQVDATAFDDASGNSYAGIANATSWSFTTGEFTNPTVSTFSPLDGTAGVNQSANLTLSFSESVVVGSGNITIKKTSGGSTVEAIDVTSGQVTGGGTATIVINPTAAFLPGTAYYIQIDATAFDDASGNGYAGIADTASWNFLTQATSSQAPVIVPTTISYAVAGVAAALEGHAVSLSWTSGANVQFVVIEVSDDSGVTWSTLASPIQNTNAYTWTAPASFAGKDLRFQVTSTDLSLRIVSSISNSISIAGPGPVPESDDSDAHEDSSAEDDEGVYGPSPVTGELEIIVSVVPGMYIKAPSFPTVYFVTDSMERRPFLNASIFFTYQETFEGIAIVTDATLPTLPLKSMMPPKPGTVLVKMPSDANVYELDVSARLHVIASEEDAISRYGRAWADYVIDLDPSIFVQLLKGGAPLPTDSNMPNVMSMKTRMQIAELQ